MLFPCKTTGGIPPFTLKSIQGKIVLTDFQSKVYYCSVAAPARMAAEPYHEKSGHHEKHKEEKTFRPG
jgi:hypothetical protein